MILQLFSGGLDSLCLWYLTGKPTPVYVHLGHKYQDREVETVMRLGDRIPGFAPEFIEGPRLGHLEQPGGHIPHRNLLLAATAAAHYPTATVILLGALLGEASPDKSRAFTRAASRALTTSEHRRCTVVAPARHLTKTGLVRAFAARFPGQVPLLDMTRSCYARADAPCGRCQACFRRSVALFHAGLTNVPPRLPEGVGLGDAVAAARGAGIGRLAALIANNTLAGLAVAGLRWPPR